jgi:hypothetical protein
MGATLLGEWDDAEASWQADAPPNPIFDDDALLLGIFAYLGTVVALRNGNMTGAADRLRLASQAAPDYPAIIAIQPAVQYAAPDDFHAEIGAPRSWFPLAWMLRLRGLNWAAHDVESQLQQRLAACDAHPEYLGLAAELGGPIAGGLGVEVLKVRARGGDATATEQLVSLLTRPCGPDRKRTELLNWMTAEKLIDSAAPVQLLANGIVTPVDPAGLAAGSPG